MRIDEKTYAAMPASLKAIFAKAPNPGSDEVLAGFPAKAGASAPVKGTEESASAKNAYGGRGRVPGAFHGDTGSAARFFYCAKASKKERNAGCESLPEKQSAGLPMRAAGGDRGGEGGDGTPTDRLTTQRNNHPTVKPIDLMAYLCRLVTPPGGVVLDPFMGSGSTGLAALREGFRFVGIEREAEYVAIACARIEHAGALGREPESPMQAQLSLEIAPC